jgi:hypothetical protein
MVQETAGRTVRRVHRAQKSCKGQVRKNKKKQNPDSKKVKQGHYNFEHQTEHPPKPSGSSLRTVVVFISAKKAPRWMQRKCDM